MHVECGLFLLFVLSHYFCWCVCEPLGCCVIQHIKQHSIKRIKSAVTQTAAQWLKRKSILFFPVINASIWCSFKSPVRTIESKGDLWFPSSVFPYIILWRWVLSPLLCHGWASISVPNDCTRAILQQSPGINLSWKRLAMNLDCLKTCVADRFHDQPSQLAVWFIPERHISREKERL